MKELVAFLLLGCTVGLAQEAPTVKETITTETRVIERPIQQPQSVIRYYEPRTVYVYEPRVVRTYVSPPVYVAPVPRRTVVRRPHYTPGPLGIFYYRNGGYTDIIYDR